jgi:Na+-driven multidrug efflux pump
MSDVGYKRTAKQERDLRAQVRTACVVIGVFLFIVIFVLIVAANQTPRSPGAGEPQGFAEGRGTLA